MSRGLGSSSYGLVLQDAYHHAMVLRLSFGCFIVTQLLSLAQCTRRKHSREGNVSLLNQDIGHVIRALLGELLVQNNTAGPRVVSYSLDQITVDGLGLPSQRQQLGLVLRVNLNFATAEQHYDFIPNEIGVELVEFGGVSRSTRFM